MNTNNALEIIDLLSIGVGAVFGILGSVTDTRGKSGKLTKWGFIAVIGIIVTNSFAMIHTYWQQLDNAEKSRKENKVLKQELQSLEKIKRDNAQELYKTGLIITKGDLSLTEQKKLQSTTGLLLGEVKSNLKLVGQIGLVSDQIGKTVRANLLEQQELNRASNNIIKQQGKMLVRQNRVDSNISRGLNPLTPFGLTITLRLKLVDSVDGLFRFYHPSKTYLHYKKANNDLLKLISRGKTGSKSGIYSGSRRGSVTLGERYIYKSDFAFLRKTEMNFNIYERDKGINSIEKYYKLYQKDLKAQGSIFGKIKLGLSNNNESEFVGDTLYNGNIFPGIHIEYDKRDSVYLVTFFSDDIRFVDNGNLRSINDLPGCSLQVTIGSFLPLRTELVAVTFHFPPSYSNRYDLVLQDKGIQSYSADPAFQFVNQFK